MSEDFSMRHQVETICLLFAVLISFVAYPIWACQCAFASPKRKYCDVDWVAHARVESFKEVNLTEFPSGIIQPKNVVYNVTYLKVYKAPKEVNETLPSEIYTPGEDALCGIFLEKGSDYLMSGTLKNDTSIITLCSQILFDDRHKSMEHNILLWKEVPLNLTKRLETHVFEPCPKRTI